MTPFDQELEHLCRIATRQPTDTDHSHKEWKTLVWRKANALAESAPADFADLPAALLKAMTAKEEKNDHANRVEKPC